LKYSILILILIILPVTIHAQTFNIRHDIKKLKIEEKGAFQSVDYTGELNVSALDNRIDQPDIPVYLYKIALDPSETVKSFTIKNVVEQRLDGTYNIQPQRELWHQDLEESPPQFNLKYEQKIYPTQVIKFLGVKHFNGIPIAHFAIYPLKYEPENQALIFVEGLDLILQTVKVEAEEISPIIEFKYENFNLTDLVQNNKSRTIKSVPMSVSDWTRDEYGIPIDYLNAGMVDRYVIITTESLKSSFKPLAEWKNKRGVPTVIRSIQWIKENFPNGVDDAERVRNFIRWSYKNRGTKYVLLGGDTELVPTRIIETGGYTFPADYYFADLDGTWNADQDNIFGEADDLLDGYPEVYISRTPVSTPNDITRFIGRLLRYEKMENIENPDFPGDVLYTAANLNKDGDSKELILKQIDPEINPSFRRTLITETDNIGSDPGPAMAELNKDYALIFTEGHGLYHTIRPGAKGSNLYNYMIGGLTNHDPGIWYVASCWTNDIAKRSLAEMYLLAEKGGGVAYIGNSSYEYPFSGIYLQKEFYNLLF
jgi:hypothetical protein